MRELKFFILLFLMAMFITCKEENTSLKKIVVKNISDIDRFSELIELPLQSLGAIDTTKYLLVKTDIEGILVVSQLIDSNADGQKDALLFRPEVSANEEKTYKIVLSDKAMVPAKHPTRCYSRFVPERTDDYAWENDRVAFRTFGPRAQEMKENDIPGGTLTSGIDAWLKKVDYPIINKWYKKELETDGTYHEDTGEGLDNFHVGSSRGVGGIAKKVDSIYYTSKNFVSWRTLNNGPLRTSFLLRYEDWDAGGHSISEEKIVTLDVGSNLSKIEIHLSGVGTISAGLTLHEKDGQIKIEKEQGWISYWQPHGDSELGTAVLVPSGNMVGHDHFISNKDDESHLFAEVAVTQNKVVYYTGFGWEKSGRFSNQAAWENYLKQFADCLRTPLVVSVE